MATHSRAKVQFWGIDEETEAKKTTRRAERLSLKRREKEVEKMELLKLKEDVRYFLVFLAQTRTDDELILEVEESETAMSVVKRMFPDIGNDDENAVDESEEAKAARVQRERLEAFCGVVRTLKLPKGTKKRRKMQVRNLHFLMLHYNLQMLYDKELDCFLQFLGGLARDKTFGDLLAEFSGPGGEEEARQMGNELETLGVGKLPASRLSDEQQASLRALMERMNDRGAYAFDGNAVQTASSGESSDSDLEEEEEF